MRRISRSAVDGCICSEPLVAAGGPSTANCHNVGMPVQHGGLGRRPYESGKSATRANAMEVYDDLQKVRCRSDGCRTWNSGSDSQDCRHTRTLSEDEAANIAFVPLLSTMATGTQQALMARARDEFRQIRIYVKSKLKATMSGRRSKPFSVIVCG